MKNKSLVALAVFAIAGFANANAPINNEDLSAVPRHSVMDVETTFTITANQQSIIIGRLGTTECHLGIESTADTRYIKLGSTFSVNDRNADNSTLFLFINNENRGFDEEFAKIFCDSRDSEGNQNAPHLGTVKKLLRDAGFILTEAPAKDAVSGQ